MAVIRRRIVRRIPRPKVRVKVVTRHWNGRCWVIRTRYEWV